MTAPTLSDLWLPALQPAGAPAPEKRLALTLLAAQLEKNLGNAAQQETHSLSGQAAHAHHFLSVALRRPDLSKTDWEAFAAREAARRTSLKPLANALQSWLKQLPAWQQQAQDAAQAIYKEAKTGYPWPLQASDEQALLQLAQQFFLVSALRRLTYG
jgi:hypothetical protein